ncbi:GNAT family N-acetyltransferase [Ramlibacter sp.]|uniref:GNAT family N-acetyltransferase n=1 Tax=Ramlibacter sp. TaxID=1917967 RepID=UPI003D132FF4
MEFRAIPADDTWLTRHAALMAACFPGTAKFTVPYLRWLYLDNPDGPVAGFDAHEGDTLAAHYACIPATAMIDGRASRVLLSLNTATHPAHQGRGLFTRLAQATYDAAAQAGFSAVYGVANANSTPGFVRKLGFQLVRPLDAQIGVGAIGIDAAAIASAAFRRTWSPAAAGWRASSPANEVHARVAHGVLQCHARAAGPLLSAYCEYPLDHAPDMARSHSAPGPLRLHLGLQTRARRPRTYVAIPERLKPSPLNLIYLSLDGRHARLAADDVSFTFLDFDAY